jgi:hypothetical protein
MKITAHMKIKEYKEPYNHKPLKVYCIIIRELLGSVQGAANKCAGQGAKESGQIFTSYKQSALGNTGVA